MKDIEQHKKFSESCLWRMQRDYFDQAGIHAWVNQVPFYITSNPFIANSYAKLVLHFIRDWINKYPNAKNHPFYILELGTGSGKFSFLALKALHELRQLLGMEDISICYIMSDFTKNNIQYYESHAALAPYLEKGLVDFAIYDMETESAITLLKRNICLTADVLVNPLTVFANYIFDTISHDAFSVENGKLYELLLSLATPEDNMKDSHPISMDQISVDYVMREIKQPYYGDPQLDSMLEEYKNTLTSTSFLLPIGSIRAINLLKKLANDKLFLISSDKGYNTLKSLDNLHHPSLSFHGSFSMMVNFHALSRYFKDNGGDYFLQTPRKGIKTSAFCSGLNFADMPATSLAMQECIEGFSPADYFTLHRRMNDSFNECNLETIAAHLNLSNWDPHIYLKLTNRINSLLEEADKDTVSFIAQNMDKIAANYYYMPKAECVLFEIAVFFHTLKNYAEAIYYYQQAHVFVGEQFSLFYNLGLCQHSINENALALENFKTALTINSDSKDTQEWIAYIKKHYANP
jgi:tetratricopeptide (TPR) repeat protein